MIFRLQEPDFRTVDWRTLSQLDNRGNGLCTLAGLYIAEP